MACETRRDLRKKHRRLETSRDLWKGKLRDNQYEMKKLRSSLAETRENRDQWRHNSEKLEATVNALTERLVNLESENNGLVLKLELSSATPNQKKTDP